jgi:hypothetical protein
MSVWKSHARDPEVGEEGRCNSGSESATILPSPHDARDERAQSSRAQGAMRITHVAQVADDLVRSSEFRS